MVLQRVQGEHAAQSQRALRDLRVETSIDTEWIIRYAYESGINLRLQELALSKRLEN